MDLSDNAIHDVIHPTAAHAPGLEPSDDYEIPVADPPWPLSQLNPKNRADSLAPLERPLWRIDGCAGLGTQFFAVPLFLPSVPPRRIDVFIPQQSSQTAEVRELLDLGRGFHTKDKARVSRLGITQHILRRLQLWTSTLHDAASWYMEQPFGTRIVFGNLSLNVAEIPVDIYRMTALESQLLSPRQLSALWGRGVDLPEQVDSSEVHVVEQLHDSVSLVRIRDKLWILKALTSYPKYFYHELKMLLDIGPHPNIVSRPAYLVTKPFKFGNKTGVIGFVSEYHQHGSLRDIIPFRWIHGMLPLSDQVKWAVQLTSALVHLRETLRSYYPDLRLDNVVLSEGEDVVMVDFEQRGVWCEFGPPEVNFLEYIRLLAADKDIPGVNRQRYIPEGVRQRHEDKLEAILPQYEDLTTLSYYDGPGRGYNIPWLCLSPGEQEMAEVYMLGRVLWCIFEAASSPQRGAVWQSYPREPDWEFPEFRRTPTPLRGLIDRCTHGRRPPLNDTIVIDGNKLVLKNRDPSATSADAVRRVAKEWWAAEIQTAEEFVDMRERLKREGQWTDNYFERPSLREVLSELEKFREDHRIPERQDVAT